ncbi:MAG: sulfatase-like hydrolase/transferase, partial [Rubripirellula sp.]
AYNAPHTPIQPPESWLAKVKDREAGIDDKRAALVALIEHMDDGIGRVLESLRSSGQFENTIIAFTSDNGGQVNVGANNGSLRDGKGSMYEGGIRIPGCIRVPGVTKAGSSTDRVCVTMDLLPTILASVGHPAMEDSVDGVSWLPLLNNPDASLPERDVFFVRREGGVQYAGLTIEALLSRNLKLVHNFPTHSFELFDLNTDPAESKDLAKSRPKDFRNMIERLQRHVQGGGEAPWQKGAH